MAVDDAIHLAQQRQAEQLHQLQASLDGLLQWTDVLRSAGVESPETSADVMGLCQEISATVSFVLQSNRTPSSTAPKEPEMPRRPPGKRRPSRKPAAATGRTDIALELKSWVQGADEPPIRSWYRNGVWYQL
eukprot:TRINITY_DN29070_c0_g1_i1.p1 TRINITY_DN29070_c0_g1~~TRINITY_DN29070_c0_g1_i1.p1  ORF type:complete len:132 (-),score=16.61 TRINITY_DN29070_c0_g1_i1:207-602(-)